MTPAVTQLGAIGSCAFYPNQPAVAMRHRKKGRGQKVFPGEGVSMNIKKTTGTLCHLEAAMVQSSLEGWDTGALDFLFIENVGNLVCPSSYDLGESLRVVLLSVTEGEDKPLKYPTIFNGADVAVITKVDLAAAVEFDEAAALKNIQAVRPGIQVFEVSAKTGAGMDQFLDFIVQQRREHAAAAV